MNKQSCKKVLLVNYDAGALLEFERLLLAADFLVVKTLWAEAAVVLAKEERFDLVLCSLNMPGMNGLEVLRKLKEAEPEITVVLFSLNVEGSKSREVTVWRTCGGENLIDEVFSLNELAGFTEKSISMKG